MKERTFISGLFHGCIHYYPNLLFTLITFKEKHNFHMETQFQEYLEEKLIPFPV